MAEILSNSESLENNNSVSTEMNFDNTLSILQEAERGEVPEGFRYDEDGCIICENDPFTDEDYDKDPSPIERVLGGIMKEGEFRLVQEKPRYYKVISKKNGHVIDVESEMRYGGYDKNKYSISEYYDRIKAEIRFDDGVKIISPQNKLVKFIGYSNILDIENRIGVVKDLESLCINFDDLKVFFGADKTETEIFDSLGNINLADNIDEHTKQQFFGEYLDGIEDVDNLLCLTLISIKNKIGDASFYKNIGNIISIIKRKSELLKYETEDRGNDSYLVPGGKTMIRYIYDLVEKSATIEQMNLYLNSPYCTITKDNIDEYFDYLSKGGEADLKKYSLDDAKLLQKYMIPIGMIDIGKITMEDVYNWEKEGITPSMWGYYGIWYNLDVPDLRKGEGVASENFELLFGPNAEGKNLYHFLDMYPQKLQNLGGKEIKEINLDTTKRNFCFRGILEMIKSRGDISVLPYPGEDASENDIIEWKESWEKVIKEYEKLLRDYISLDFEINEKGERNQIYRSRTFDKIFYDVGVGSEDPNGAVSSNSQQLKECFQSFSKNKILDYSSTIDENGNLDQKNQKKLVEDLCVYAKSHPNEKILVYVAHHGLESGATVNGWEKEDWLKISKYPNVNIMTIRCYFGRAYGSENNGSGDYIYDQPSPLSGFSNREPAWRISTGYIVEGMEKGLGYHEMQLYCRLKYPPISETPLTDYMEYNDWITGEKKKKIIGLAYEGEGEIFENNA